MGDTADKTQQAITAKNKGIIIGNDEVGSPNLPSSSTENPVTAMVTGFCYFLETDASPQKYIQKYIRGPKNSQSTDVDWLLFGLFRHEMILWFLRCFELSSPKGMP